ncbi:MAG: hypothetical protein JNK53_07940 [Phycisphaerae bacterium]|nr:hypothetical protein [Phycisphaerae bacterium]
MRRTCWLAIVGLALVAAVLLAVGVPNGPNTMAERLPRAASALLAAFAVALCLNWQLRIESDGLSRRRVFRRDDWSWDDVGSGRLEKPKGFGLIDPARPWWRRRLSLDCLDPADRCAVLSSINARYRLPPPPNLPLCVELRVNDRMRLNLDALGVSLRKRWNKGSSFAAWSEVQRIEFLRADAPRRNFIWLEMQLPGETIRLGEPSNWDRRPLRWTGASHDVVSEFLKANAACCNIVDRTSLDEPTREDLEHQLRACLDRQRSMRVFALVVVLAVAGFVTWAALSKGSGALAFAGIAIAMLGVFLAPILVMQHRIDRASVSELRRQLAAAAPPAERA